MPHSSEFYGRILKISDSSNGGTTPKIFKIVAEVDEEKQTSKDRWRGLAFDASDDQQDITRGKGAVDSLFQAPIGSGTHYAVMSSYDYVSSALRQYKKKLFLNMKVHHFSSFFDSHVIRTFQANHRLI